MIDLVYQLARAPGDALRVARSRFPVIEPVAWSAPFKVSNPELALRALIVAQAEAGHGEVCEPDGKYRNRGPDIQRYCAPFSDGHEWCAAFFGYAYQQAALGFGIVLPFERSLGAKQLGKNMAKVGRRFTDPALVLPGDLMVLERGPMGSWQGHAVMVKRVKISSLVVGVEGNHGPFVAVDTVRDILAKKNRFSAFYSIRTEAEARMEIVRESHAGR